MLYSSWFVPFDESSEEDKLAVDRALDFMLGWYTITAVRIESFTPLKGLIELIN